MSSDLRLRPAAVVASGRRRDWTWLYAVTPIAGVISMGIAVWLSLAKVYIGGYACGSPLTPIGECYGPMRSRMTWIEPLLVLGVALPLFTLTAALLRRRRFRWFVAFLITAVPTAFIAVGYWYYVGSKTGWI